MENNASVVSWVAFFLMMLLLLAFIAFFFIEPREIVVNQSQAHQIGSKIGVNEGVTSRISQVAWHQDDRYSTLGIARFIWYPPSESRESMSFNGLLTSLSQSGTLPHWLMDVEDPPWHSKDAYMSVEHDVFKRQLGDFLQENIGEQTQYLILNIESTLPNIIKVIQNPFAKMHAYENFYRIAMQDNGVYALLDYVVFQGDGLALNERYNNQGWGLLQVLENMSENSDNLLQGFMTSANYLLTRRIANAPSNETKLLPAWQYRLRTYTQNPNDF